MLELLEKGMAPLGILTPIPWLFIIFKDLPAGPSGPKKFRKYHIEQVMARKKVGFSFPFKY